MPKKEKFVVATKKEKNGVVVPDRPLGKFRKIEFAQHALPGLITQHNVAVAQLAIFQGGAFVRALP